MDLKSKPAGDAHWLLKRKLMQSPIPQLLSDLHAQLRVRVDRHLITLNGDLQSP